MKRFFSFWLKLATLITAVIASSCVLSAASPAHIVISSNPAGAAVWMDGEPTGQVTPYESDSLEPGLHQFRLVMEGYQEHVQEFNIKAGQKLEFGVELMVQPVDEELSLAGAAAGSAVSGITDGAGEIEDFSAAGSAGDSGLKMYYSYDVVQVKPLFKGYNLNYFRDWVIKNVHRRTDDPSGVMVVHFVVDKQGHVSDVMIGQSLGNKLDSQVEKIVRTSKYWTPGKNNGEPVSVRISLPIEFLPVARSGFSRGTSSLNREQHNQNR